MVSFVNLTTFNVTYNTTCVLDQAKLIEQTTKIPIVGYLILVVGLVSLLFYFFVQPNLKQSVQEGLGVHIGRLGVCLVFLSTWVLFVGVFQLSEEALTHLSKVSIWFLLPLVTLILWLGYKYYKRRKIDGE